MEIDLDIIRNLLKKHPDLLDCCTDRQKKILQYRLGLPPYSRPHTLGSTGDVFNLSAERIRQIQDAALRQVKSHFESTVLFL